MARCRRSTSGAAARGRAARAVRPELEHDACGVGFVAQHQGREVARDRRAGARSARQPRAPRRCGCDPLHRRRRRHPDPDAARVLRRASARGSAFELPEAGQLRRRHGVPAAATRRAARALRGADRAASSRREGRRCSAGATCRSTASSAATLARESMPVIRQLFVGRGRRDAGRARARAQAVRASASASRRPSRERASPTTASFYVLQPLVAHDRLQGPADRRAARDVLPRPARPDVRERARAGALALQHQHVPDLGARAPVPLPRAQRRDQHAARQRQLDARARERCSRRRLFGDDLEKLLPIIDAGRQRLGDVRQRARAAACRPAARCRTR